MFSFTFLKDLLERSIASAAGALLSANVVLDGAIFSETNLKLALGAAVASILKALVASKIGSQDSASLVG